jgi:hypothetical protein
MRSLVAARELAAVAEATRKERSKELSLYAVCICSGP